MVEPEKNPSSLPPPRDRRQRAGLGEVGDQRGDGEPLMLLRQPRGRLVQDSLRRYRWGCRPGRLASAPSKQARLAARPGAELDQHASRPRQLGDLGAMGLEQRRLDARRVIFLELGDLLEQLRADGVVEEAARDAPRRASEARQHGFGEFVARAPARWARARSQRRPLASAAEARRRPPSRLAGQAQAHELPALMGIEEIAVGRRMWPSGVTQEPPRSTN